MFTKFRTGPAVFALSAAILFVFFRVSYRVIFGGVVVGTNFLPALPQINLPGPFSHISLFGPVTLDGLIATAISALPFALTVFLFGMTVAFVDTARLSKTLTQKNAPAIVRAFGVALATLPKLLDRARKISETAKLRHGPKARHLWVPILGSALDRALALATQMELRHGNSQTALGSIRITSRNLVIDGIKFGNFDAAGPGLIFITGPNGSGKSTFLRAVAGLWASDGRVLSGELEVFAPSSAGAVGYLPQDPRLGFMGESVSQEFELNGISPQLFDWREDQNLSTLSEGEAKLLALEILMATNPMVVLLDEPFDGLDATQRGRLLKKLEAISKKSLVAIAAPTIQLVKRESVKTIQLVSDGFTSGEFQYKSMQKTGLYPPPRISLALEKNNLTAKSFEKVIFQNQSLQLFEGALYSLEGPNGSGKTSLLKLLVSDQSRLVPENFQDLFVTGTLEAELLLSDKFLKSEPGLSKATFFSLLHGAENQDADKLLATHPRDLSYATSLALAIAIQVVHKPKVLLLDEPGKGFDPVAKAATIEALKCVAETGTAILYATHDPEFVAAAHRRLRIQNQQIREVTLESVEG